MGSRALALVLLLAGALAIHLSGVRLMRASSETGRSSATAGAFPIRTGAKYSQVSSALCEDGWLDPESRHICCSKDCGGCDASTCSIGMQCCPGAILASDRACTTPQDTNCAWLR